MLSSVVIMAACGASLEIEPPPPSAIPQLEMDVQSDSTDTDAVAELAAAYRGADRSDEARLLLERGRALNPEDQAIPVLLGLTYEDLEEFGLARSVYQEVLSEGDGSLRDVVRDRLDIIATEELLASVRDALARESELSSLPPTPNTVGVFPFRVEGDPDLEPLSRAMAEFLVTDLSITGRLQVLERVRVQTLLLGAMRDGTKEVLALRSGYRESVESWSEVLRDLKARGIEAPRLLMADGNAAIWGAVRQVWPEAGEQRCWNHKMRNVLDRLPQREQSEAKDLLRAVVYATSQAEAVKAREAFARRYRPWYPKAVDVLEDDWERMVAFYDFPEDHWKHLRTTNVVESPFAAVRLRTSAAKRFKRVESATALIWKLLLVAEKRFRRLDAPHLLNDVFEGIKFEDGKPVSNQQRKNAA